MSLPLVADAPMHASEEDRGPANAGLERGAAAASYRVFDEHADDYNRWFTKHATIYQAELEAARQMLPRTGVGLEIGVGTGRFAVPLGITIGVEPAWHMAAAARSRGVAVCLGLGEQLPLRDGAVDFALLVTVTCFVTDVSSLLREAHRVIKPGGHLINAFIDRDSPLGQAYEARKATHTFYRYAHFHSAPEVSTYTREAGFSDLRFCQTLRGIPGRSPGAYQVRDGYGQGAFVVIDATK